MSKPFISICIPAYKNVDFLKRLLDSISIQSFKDFEVIITDDSNDDSVALFVQTASYTFKISYIKNKVALGSPENWNEGIRNASGEYIKMMHDDDWFSNPKCLQEFAIAAQQNPNVYFIFSGFTEVDLINNKERQFVLSAYYLNHLKNTPLYLFKQNFIGHPSTTLIKNVPELWYDKELKWVVDIEFYIRFLNAHPRLIAIQKPLINIGINEFQITKQVFRNPEVEIPETLYLYNKLPPKSLHNIYVFDYYWRLIRNLSIRKVEDMEVFSKGIKAPRVIQNMISLQAKYPLHLLGKGVISKVLMLSSYLLNYKRL